MKRVSARAYARAGLLGNPSDGYNGKTISMIVGDYFAEVTFAEASVISIEPAEGEDTTFLSLSALRDRIGSQGYYGSERLVKAALRRFTDFVANYPDDALKKLNHTPNFSVSIRSSIPRQVGLAGSSAIVMATLRAAMQWFDIRIEPSILAALTLSAERDELGIPAGLQDRVIQAFEGIVFMDFSKEKMKSLDGLELGDYRLLENMDTSRFYISYSTHGGEPTEVTHSRLRERFQAGEQSVVDAMQQFAALAEEGRNALVNANWNRLHDLINANFDLRRSICHLHPHHIEMIETARGAGASAKFCGSGGAIIGTVDDEQAFQELQQSLAQIGCYTFQPQVGHFQ